MGGSTEANGEAIVACLRLGRQRIIGHAGPLCDAASGQDSNASAEILEQPHWRREMHRAFTPGGAAGMSPRRWFGGARWRSDRPLDRAQLEDDSEPAPAETPEAGQLIVQPPSRRRVCANAIEARTNLTLQLGMEASYKALDPPWHSETIGHAARLARSAPGQ